MSTFGRLTRKLFQFYMTSIWDDIKEILYRKANNRVRRKNIKFWYYQKPNTYYLFLTVTGNQCKQSPLATAGAPGSFRRYGLCSGPASANRTSRFYIMSSYRISWGEVYNGSKYASPESHFCRFPSLFDTVFKYTAKKPTSASTSNRICH